MAKKDDELMDEVENMLDEHEPIPVPQRTGFLVQVGNRKPMIVYARYFVPENGTYVFYDHDEHDLYPRDHQNLKRIAAFPVQTTQISDPEYLR